MVSKTEAPQDQVARPTIDERYSIEPVAAHVEDGMLWVTLKGGRIIATPLEWYPQLGSATPEQLAAVRFNKIGLRWDELDVDLSVRGMIRGCDGYIDSLDAVMTVSEITEVYNLTRGAVHDALRHDWLPSRLSGKTHLIRRRDAEERWGDRLK